MLMSQCIEKNVFGIYLFFSVLPNQALVLWGVHPVGFILPFNCENVTSDNNTTLTELYVLK